MNQNKKSENKDICDQLIRIHHDIKSHAKKGQFQKADTLLSLASKLYTHQKMIEKTPDWPYTNRNMGSLFISILIPVIIGIIQKYI